MQRPGCTRRRLLVAAGLALPTASIPTVGSPSSVGDPPSPPSVRWVREYGDAASFNDAAPAHGGGVVIVGSILGGGPASDRAWIVSVDDAGAVRWQRRLGPAGRTEFHSVVRTDGGYAVGGVRRPAGEEDLAGWLAILGQDGTIRDQTTHRDQSRVFRATAVGVGDGFALAGSEGGAETASTWLAGFDADATERWSVGYRHTYDLDGLLGTRDGPVAVGTRVGQTDDAGLPWIAALDANGRMRWTTTVDVWPDDDRWTDDDGWYDVGAAIPAADGGFVLAGRSILEPDEERAVLHRLDANRAVRWAQEISALEHGFPVAIHRVDDGYLVAGTDERDGIVLAAIDGDGSTRWSHAYGGTPDHELAATVDLGDGRYLLVGEVDASRGTDRDRGWAATLSPEAGATTLGQADPRGVWTPTSSGSTVTTTAEPTTTGTVAPATTETSVTGTTDGGDRAATTTPGQPGFGATAAIVAAATAVGLSRRRGRLFEP